MSDEINDEAAAIVGKACSEARSPPAMAAALARIAGNAFARFTSHDDAFLLHTKRAREHQLRMGQKRHLR